MKRQGKRFLTNRGDEGGSVRWYVETEEECGGLFGYQVMDSSLHITDCDKCITLEFSCPDYKAFTKRIAKLDELLAELASFRTALQQAQSSSAPKKFHY